MRDASRLRNSDLLHTKRCYHGATMALSICLIVIRIIWLLSHYLTMFWSHKHLNAYIKILISAVRTVSVSILQLFLLREFSIVLLFKPSPLKLGISVALLLEKLKELTRWVELFLILIAKMKCLLHMLSSRRLYLHKSLL